jgi:hypothetical protein
MAKKQITIKKEVDRRMKEETPLTYFLQVGLSPFTHLRKKLHKKQIIEELKSRPNNLSASKVKLK